MNERIDNIDLIEKALLDNLSQEEMILFRQKMKVEQFAITYQQELAIFQEVNKSGRIRLKKKLQSIEKDMPQVVQLNNLRRMYWIGAASILLMASFFLIKHFLSTTLFEDHYQPMANVVDPISKAELSNESAFQLYEQQRYDEALIALEQLSDHPAKLMYLALCHLELSNLNQAKVLFQEISNDKNHEFYEEAQWYLALTHLRNDQPKSAIRQLQEITDSNSFFAQRAQQLLKEIQDE